MFTFMTVRSVGIALSRVNGHTDCQMESRPYVARLKIAFRRCFANAPKKKADGVFGMMACDKSRGMSVPSLSHS
jgi:hypothetical protein